VNKEFIVNVYCGRGDVMVAEKVTASDATSRPNWDGFRIAEKQHDLKCGSAKPDSIAYDFCWSRATSFEEPKKQYIVEVVLRERIEVQALSEEEAEDLARNHLYVESDNGGSVSPEGCGEVEIENVEED
jgi:hypothetical protein